MTQKRAFMPLYIVLGQQRAYMPVYIGKSGDLVGWHRCLTYSQTTEYSATQLVSSIKLKLSHAIVILTKTLCWKKLSRKMLGLVSHGRVAKRQKRLSKWRNQRPFPLCITYSNVLIFLLWYFFISYLAIFLHVFQTYVDLVVQLINCKVLFKVS